MITRCPVHEKSIGSSSNKCSECGQDHGYVYAGACIPGCPDYVEGPTSADKFAAEALKFIEAARNTAREETLEAELSLKDWVDRIAAATKQAARNAREADMWTQLEAWHEVSAIVLGRIEQVMRLMEQAECDHAWPEKAQHTDSCPKCGKTMGDHMRDAAWDEALSEDDA